MVQWLGDEAKSLPLFRGYSVGVVGSCANNFRTPLIRVNHKAVEAFMGSSINPGDAVYAYAWVVNGGDCLAVSISETEIGFVGAARFKSEVKRLPLSSRKNAVYFPCRMSVKSNGKREVRISLMERLPRPPAIPIPDSAMNGELTDITGRFGHIGTIATQVTLKQALNYVFLDEDNAGTIRDQTPYDSPEPQYWMQPNTIWNTYTGLQLTWESAKTNPPSPTYMARIMLSDDKGGTIDWTIEKQMPQPEIEINWLVQ